MNCCFYVYKYSEREKTGKNGKISLNFSREREKTGIPPYRGFPIPDSRFPIPDEKLKKPIGHEKKEREKPPQYLVGVQLLRLLTIHKVS